MYQHGLVSLSMGVALPAYELGSARGIDVSAYATTGTSLIAEGMYFYSWHAGVVVMINYNVNPIDNNRLAKGYLDLSSAFKTASAKTEPFRDLSILTGMVFDIPVNDFFSVTFKMVGGLRNVYKPTALIETTTAFSTVNYYETSDNQMLFAFLGSVGTRIRINDSFNLNFAASYIGSTFDFEYMRNNKDIYQTSHIGVLSITGGVSYSF